MILRVGKKRDGSIVVVEELKTRGRMEYLDDVLDINYFKNFEELRHFVSQLNKALKKPIVKITHD